MQGIPLRQAGRDHGQAGRGCAALLCVALALTLSGCAAGIQTPLPEMPRSSVSTSMSQQERQKAVNDLTHARDTHEQDAEKQIEQSR